MKIWKRKKKEIENFRLPIGDIRRHLIPIGYYANRPKVWYRITESGEIGRYEGFRFIESTIA